MSRILEALDQLERADSLECSKPEASQDTDLKASGPISQLPKTHGSRCNRIWILVAVAAVSFGASFFWFYPHDKTSVPNQGRNKKFSEPRHFVAEQMSPDSVDHQQMKTAPSILTEDPAATLPSSAIAKPDSRSASPTTLKPATMEVSTEPKGAASTPIKLIFAQKIRLQAIAWSPVAADRMAVINDEIVREGDSVEGLSVIAINIDDVLFNDRGHMQKAILGHPN